MHRCVSIQLHLRDEIGSMGGHECPWPIPKSPSVQKMGGGPCAC